MESRTKLIPGPDHPITIEPTSDRVVVQAGGQVVADSNAALTLREAGHSTVHYIPLDDVVPGTLRPEHAAHSYCPYKGDASYYDIVLPDGTELADAVWTYPSPYPAVEAIAGYVAFYPDRVQITTATSRPEVQGQRTKAPSKPLADGFVGPSGAEIDPGLS